MTHAGFPAAIFAFVATALALAPAASRPPATGEQLVLINATILDGLGSPPRRDASLVIRSGRIDRIVTGKLRVPPGSRVIDLKGAWLFPGMIDAHVHLRDLDSARRALRSGVTTARSMGVDDFLDVHIARLHASGASDLPEVVPSGYHLRRRPAASLFAEFPELRSMAGTMTGEQAVRKIVGINVRRGAQVIKIMATERAGVPETDFKRRMLDDGEIRAAVAEAALAGLPVAAHAHSDNGARAAVVAGVRSIEHGTMLTDRTLRMMRRRNVCFVPTLSFWADMAGPGGEYDDPLLAKRARAMQPQVRRAVAAAARIGVQIAVGSDMRYDSVSPFRASDEVSELVRGGLSPARAIMAATSVAASCLGIGHRTGAVRRGLEADLIAVTRSPLADVLVLGNVRLVVNDGVVAVNAL